METARGADGKDVLSVPAGSGPRCWACTGLFILALIAAMYFAAPLLLPIVLAVLFNLLLSPAVRSLKRIGVPMPLGALLVLLGVLGGLGALAWQLAAPASDWFARSPSVLSELQHKLRPISDSVRQVQKATEEVEKAAHVGGREPTREVKVKGPSLLERVMASAQEILVGGFMMLVLLYFLMASEDFFLRKLVRLIPRLRDKIVAVEIGRTIEVRIGHYFMSFAAICLGVGIAVTLMAWGTGLPSPALWGVVAGVLNFVPYLGPATSLGVITVVSLLTFDELSRALLPPLLYLVIEAIEGNVIQPMTFGRNLSLNPVAIFVALLFLGWLWSAAGILLAVPILVAVKVAADHIEALHGVAEFLDRN